MFELALDSCFNLSDREWTECRTGGAGSHPEVRVSEAIGHGVSKIVILLPVASGHALCRRVLNLDGPVAKRPIAVSYCTQVGRPAEFTVSPVNGWKHGLECDT